MASVLRLNALRAVQVHGAVCWQPSRQKCVSGVQQGHGARSVQLVLHLCAMLVQQAAGVVRKAWLQCWAATSAQQAQCLQMLEQPVLQPVRSAPRAVGVQTQAVRQRASACSAPRERTMRTRAHRYRARAQNAPQGPTDRVVEHNHARIVQHVLLVSISPLWDKQTFPCVSIVSLASTIRLVVWLHVSLARQALGQVVSSPLRVTSAQMASGHSQMGQCTAQIAPLATEVASASVVPQHVLQSTC